MTNAVESKTNKELTERILEILTSVGWMTFPQLIRTLKGEGYKVEGNSQLSMTPTSVKCWFGMSEELTSSLIDLFNQDVIRPLPATPQLYGMENLDFGSMPILLDYPKANFPEGQQEVLFLSFLSIVSKDPAPTQEDTEEDEEVLTDK